MNTKDGFTQAWSQGERLKRNLVASNEDECGATERIQRVRDVNSIIPRITIDQGIVRCNDAELDLKSRLLPLKLFKVFLKRRGEPLRREDLLEELHDITSPRAYSSRFIESTYGNMIKMISRTRIKALANLSAGGNKGIEWFVYDQARKTWTFYQLSADYVQRHLLDAANLQRCEFAESPKMPMLLQ